jgi:hypothetical protein
MYIRSMKNLIEIERIPYEEPNCINLIVKASNNYSASQLEIYDNADALLKCAEALENFPRHSTDSFLWELGSERPEDNFAFYFRFRLFMLDPAGHGCIQIRFNNNGGFPDRAISEFCITCEAAGISKLGKLFKEFSKLKSRKLTWDGIDGEIIV